MPLPLPVLDNRSWSELVSEGRALIPRVAPAWTELSPGERTSRGRILTVHGGVVTDHSRDNGAAGFLPFGRTPKVGDSMELGFDSLPATPAETASLYCWTTSWEADAGLREAI